MNIYKFPYKWTLKDTRFAKNKGTVFSCFACGGGSTMGYKLAGFDVLGCNEIDSKMMQAYKINHNPKYSYLESIQTFKDRNDLPDELYNLDILDGSPPCSSFSMAGNREKDWGKEKKFREGQASQILDNLFFDFIDVAKKLQPKVVIAENVKGLLLGNAIKYVRRIYDELEKAGYYVQHWLLDASKMGVPQRRERVFFICLRKDIAKPFLEQMDFFTIKPKLKLEFEQPDIILKEILNNENDEFQGNESKLYLEYWNNTKKGEAVGKFQAASKRLDENKICNTIAAQSGYIHFHPNKPRQLSKKELCFAGTYPFDYNFLNITWHYLIGMSVPPVMIAQITTEIYNQWLSKIKK